MSTLNKPDTCSDSKSKQLNKGTINSGYDYESLVPAYFALELLKDENVRTFHFELNSSSFGKFDDLIVTIVYTDNKEEHFAIQLKHREEGKDQLLALHEFKRRDNKMKGKSFNIVDYLKAFSRQDKNTRGTYKWILFTNAEFLEIDQVKDYDIVNSPKNLKTRLFNEEGVYQFSSIEGKNSDVSREFYNKFFLISKQKNVTEMRKSIHEIFREEFHSDDLIATCYIDFFHQLRRNVYNNTEIDRDAIILNLANLLIATWTIIPSVDADPDPKIGLLEEAFQSFDLAVISDVHKCFIANTWKYASGNFTTLAKELKLLKEEGSEKDEYACMKFLRGPLFVRFNEESQEVIYSVAAILQTLENQKVKLVLVGKDVDETKFRGWEIFKNLKMLKNGDLHRKLSDMILISIQGKKAISLRNLCEEYGLQFDELITPNELFHCCQGRLRIGEKTENLPDCYITRNLLRPDISINDLKNLCADKVVVVHCSGNSEAFVKLLRSKDFQPGITETTENGLKRKTGLIFTDEPRIKDEHRSFHHFKFIQGKSLHWMEEKIDPSQASVFENQINFLCGEAGIGKTTMLKYLSHTCPPNNWITLIPLQKINTSSFEFSKLFLQLEKSTGVTQMFCNYFIQKKKIIFLFDGLDELNSKSVVQVIDGIKRLVEEGYKVWISCRNSNYIDDNIFKDAYLYGVENFNENQQEEYVSKRLRDASIQEETVKSIINNLFGNNIENKDILKSPQILFILTEILRSDDNRFVDFENKLTLVQMYANFLDGQILHSLEKSKCSDQCDTFTKLEAVTRGFKNYYFKGCQTIAIQTCLEQDLLESFKINIDENLDKYMKQHGSLSGVLKFENDTFIFIHQTFAEYFAAMWLSENFVQIPIDQRDFLFKNEYTGVKRFFDTKLAENCPLHLAILDEDIDRVKKHTDTHWDYLDKGGRSPLQLAVSTGKRHLLSKKYLGEDCAKHQEILKYLIPKASGEDLLAVDSIFQWNLFEFAEASMCLFALEELSKIGEVQWNYLKGCENQLPDIIYHCVTKGYKNLLKIMIEQKSLSVLYKSYPDKPLLHLAVETNQKEVVSLLIANGADFDEYDSRRLTPLHQTAILGHTEIAQLLLKTRVDIEAKDASCKTALDLAVKMGQEAMVELLVEKKADIETKDRDFNTPLHRAAYRGKTKILKFLMDHGAKVNAANFYNKYALHRAASMGHLDTVKCLVEHKANTEAKDKAKRTALHYAAYDGHEEIVKYLINQEVNVFATDEDGKTARKVAEERKHPRLVAILEQAESSVLKDLAEEDEENLHKAARKGSVEEIRRLIDTGEDIEKTNQKGETILHTAALQGYSALVSFLLTRNVNTAAIDCDNRVALHYACQFGHFDIAKLLLNKGQNTAADKWGFTPLHRAASKGHLRIVELLAKAEVDINCSSREGTTPLHSASRGGHIPVISYLVSKGADIAAKNEKKESCLHLAVQRRRTETVKYLIGERSNLLLEVDYLGRNPLHFAAQKGYKDIIEVLIEAGLDINEIDNIGETAQDIACNAGQDKIAEYLKSLKPRMSKTGTDT